MGAVTGSPTAMTIDMKLQESDTSGGTYTDVAGATMTQISGTGGNTQGSIKAGNLVALKNFVKVVVTPAFTGGTSPAVLVGASAFLGPEKNQPA